MTRVSVVGHTEWVEFVRVARQPPRGGLAEGTSLGTRVGGGAVVAALALRELGARVDFYTALCDDERSRRARAQLRERGVDVHAAVRPGTTRCAFTTLEDGGERTIVTVGERHAPGSDDDLDLAPLHAADGVYATACDAGLLGEAARGRGAVVITTRIGTPREYAGVTGVTAAVFSASDPRETAGLEDWARIARLLVATEGDDGGHWREGTGRPRCRGRWPAAPLPGRVRDSYGAGDSFAAGFTYGLATGEDVAGAAAIAARCGARAMTRVGGP